MKSLLLGLALSVAAVTALADDNITLYKVEVIVFENLDPNAIHAEEWPANPGTPPLDNAVELSAITAPPASPDAGAAPSATAVSPVPAGAAAATSTGPGNASPQPSQPSTAATAATTPLDVSSTAPVATATADTPPPPPAPSWRWLDDSDLSLNPQVQRLNHSQNYKTILHVGWIQPVDNTDQGTAIHLYDGMESTRGDDTTPPQAATIPLTTDPTTGPPPVTRENDNTTAPPMENPAATENDNTQPQEEADQPTTDASVVDATPPSHILDGTFTLRRGRFLHVDVDLGYTKIITVEQPAAPTDAGTATTPDNPPSPPQTTRIYVRLVDSRRIRDDSLNYLDHPLFGVLFTVTPYQPPAADTPANP